jgi:hypothetical protein
MKMLHKVRIALAVTILALAAVSVVNSASACRHDDCVDIELRVLSGVLSGP